jgi:uncharacterized protein (TIGR02246 family)
MKKLKYAKFYCLLFVLVPVFFCAATQAKTKPVNQVVNHDQDKTVLQNQASDYEKAFVAGDATTISQMWTADGTYTDVDGGLFKGREAIYKYFSDNFKEYGSLPLKITVESIKFPSDNIAVEEGHSRLLDGPNIDLLSRYIVIHQKTNNKWRMANVIETIYPSAIEGSLDDWQWLIGNWSAKPSPDNTMHILASWATGHKFIRCLFRKESVANGEQFAMVVIGKDPNSGQIVSWHFDPSGGFGSGKWIKDGDTWIERANSTEESGVTGTAFYIMHKLDDNTFTWRSTQRYRGDENLPDTPEITIYRD